MHADETRAEARRVLGICNACGYCNGFCDLFEAARRRAALSDADLAHLANLCHACRNCFHACQYAPPHAFAVNVPRALARMRHQVYREQVWPTAMSGLLSHPLAAVAGITLGAILLLVGLVLALVPWEPLFSRQIGSGAFYRLVPWWSMVMLGLLPLGWSTLAIGVGLRRYWRLTRPRERRVTPRALRAALRDVLILRNLSGGGPGCNDLDERFGQTRRWLHQSLLAGLLLSFAATVAATLYHHLLGQEAPYPLLSAPVLLGTLGGIAMTVAALGLAWIEWRADPRPMAAESRRLDQSFLALLFLVAVSGLVLLAWRETAAMGLLLLVHLGTVLAFFLVLPYGKFVHAGYRTIALLVEAIEHPRLPRDGRVARKDP